MFFLLNASLYVLLYVGYPALTGSKTNTIDGGQSYLPNRWTLQDSRLHSKASDETHVKHTKLLLNSQTWVTLIKVRSNLKIVWFQASVFFCFFISPFAY